MRPEEFEIFFVIVACDFAMATSSCRRRKGSQNRAVSSGVCFGRFVCNTEKANANF